MRTEDEIQMKVRTLLLEEFDRRIREAEQRLPHRCFHNHRQALDARREIAGEPNDGFNRVDRHHLPLAPTMGLCLLGSDDPENWPGNICDDPIDARRCPDFTPARTKDEILTEFREQVADPAWVEVNLPVVHVLMWSLESSRPNFHLPWWKRLWFRFLRLRVEPVQMTAVHLLPAGGNDGVHGS